MDGWTVLAVLKETAEAIGEALGALGDWGPAGTRPGQYRSDLAADAVAVEHLGTAGFAVLSEESGLHAARALGGPAVTVVVDPLDGSSNAARGVPWYATSLCALDAEGPLAAVVVDLVHHRRYEAVRGAGASCDGQVLRPSATTALGSAFVGLSGLPPRHLGWRQYRALGACALDLCAVAGGVLDGYIDCSVDAHGGWDYLGGLLVCREAGVAIADAEGRDLVVRGHGDRRTPVAAGTPDLLDALLTARRSFT